MIFHGYVSHNQMVRYSEKNWWVTCRSETPTNHRHVESCQMGLGAVLCHQHQVGPLSGDAVECVLENGENQGMVQQREPDLFGSNIWNTVSIVYV